MATFFPCLSGLLCVSKAYISLSMSSLTMSGLRAVGTSLLLHASSSGGRSLLVAGWVKISYKCLVTHTHTRRVHAAFSNLPDPPSLAPCLPPSLCDVFECGLVGRIDDIHDTPCPIEVIEEAMTEPLVAGVVAHLYSTNTTAAAARRVALILQTECAHDGCTHVRSTCLVFCICLALPTLWRTLIMSVFGFSDETVSGKSPDRNCTQHTHQTRGEYQAASGGAGWNVCIAVQLT